MTTRQTLLLADDDPAVTDSLAPFLERAGFHVLVAIDGKNALEKAQSHKPDMIILDVLMPRLVRVPGSCVMGTAACPEPGFTLVPGYPNKDATVLPLAWSLDGSAAVIVHSEQSGTARISARSMTAGSWAVPSSHPTACSWLSLTAVRQVNGCMFTRSMKVNIIS